MTTALSKPRVFISSTIRDLADLRSALRHWLESAGYDVQLSEYTDFDRSPDDDTFESCFANVAKSDYYILLVGSARGGWYDERERVTITRQEFRIARQAASQRPIRIIAFVRTQVATALKQWQDDGRPKCASSVLADPVFTDEFIQEVEALDNEGQGVGSRWVYRFSDFRDIIDALRGPLRLDTDIERRLLRDNLLNELLYNLSLLVTKSGKERIFAKHSWVGSVRKGITIRKDDIGKTIWLTSKQLGMLGLIAVGNPWKALRQEAIGNALTSGLFLNVNPQTGEMEETEANAALASLHSDILALMSWSKEGLANDTIDEFVILARQANRRELENGTDVSVDKLTILLAVHDRTEDVFNGTSKFAQWLLEAYDSPTISRNPRSPIEGASEAIEAERVTGAELKWALTKGIHPFGPFRTPEDKELVLRDVDSAVEQLRVVFPPGTSDETLAEVVREAFEVLIVEPFPGEDGDSSSPPQKGSRK